LAKQAEEGNRLPAKHAKYLDGRVSDDTMLINATEWPAMVAGHRSSGKIG